mmetsp:Transcript_25621/g.59501  ORF Transcript_25621/g.59501 Transcript_25621/m.59501 type:complete len:223 (-) Transcript_25621:58-726(-)
MQGHLGGLLLAVEVAPAQPKAWGWLVRCTALLWPDFHPLRHPNSWQHRRFLLLQIVLNAHSRDANLDQALQPSGKRGALLPQRGEDLQAREDRGQVAAAIQVEKAEKASAGEEPGEDVEERDEVATQPEVDTQHGELPGPDLGHLVLHGSLPGIAFHDADAFEDLAQEVDALVLNVLQLHHVDSHGAADDDGHGQGWDGHSQAKECRQPQLDSHENQKQAHR